jgi:hypothetical protein
MKLIIAGSRDLEISTQALQELMLTLVGNPRVILNGHCPTGIDKVAAKMTSFSEWELEIHPPLWKEHGKAAGPIRNKQMAEVADKLLLVWDGESKGSANMKSEMQKLGKPVIEVIIKK